MYDQILKPSLEKSHAIINTSTHQHINTSTHQHINTSKNSVRTFARLSSLAVIVSFGCISQAQAARCNSLSTGNWNTAGTWECFDGFPPTSIGNQVPGNSDSANIESSHTITVDTNVAVLMLQFGGGTLNAGSYNFVLSNGEVIRFPSGGTFNAQTSTVKLTDANHTFAYNTTFYNLQWATPLTAPRTLTINSSITITKATGGTFNLDGTATNPVTFAGAGNFASPITVNNCAGKPATMTNLTCNAPVANNPVNAPIDFHFSKQVETFATEIEIK